MLKRRGLITDRVIKLIAVADTFDDYSHNDYIDTDYIDFQREIRFP